MTFGLWSIDKGLFDWLCQHFPKGKTLLELGSGQATKKLNEFWNVFSVEEDEKWINLFHKQYVHAPIVDGWYDPKALEALPSQYDLLLVDGPAHGKRNLLNRYLPELNFFSSGCSMIVFDDVNRLEDLQCYQTFLALLDGMDLEYETEMMQTEQKKFAWVRLVGCDPIHKTSCEINPCG